MREAEATDGSGAFLIPSDERFLVALCTPSGKQYKTTVLDLRSGEIVADLTTPKQWVTNGTTVQMMNAMFSACDPTFTEGVQAATKACDPASPQVSYSCDLETGKVECSWTCAGQGGGEAR